MSDFGEICPLFQTGVYSELCISGIRWLTTIGTTQNILEGTITAGTGAGQISFGRTVVVTGCYVRKGAYGEQNAENENLYLQHRTSAGATPTAFGTANVTSTVSIYTPLTYWAMNISASKTFTSSEVLSLGMGTVTAVDIGDYELIIRYREK